MTPPPPPPGSAGCKASRRLLCGGAVVGGAQVSTGKPHPLKLLPRMSQARRRRPNGVFLLQSHGVLLGDVQLVEKMSDVQVRAAASAEAGERRRKSSEEG